MRILSTTIRAFAIAGALTAGSLVVAGAASSHPSFGGIHSAMHGFHGFGGMHGMHTWGGHMGGWGHGGGGWGGGHGGWGHGWHQHNRNWNKNVNRNINRNVNINRNFNRNVNVNRNSGHGHWGHGHWGHGHGQHGFQRWRDGFGRWHWAEAVGAFALPFADYGYGSGGGYADDNYSGADSDDYNVPYANDYDSDDDSYAGDNDYDGDDRGGCPCRCDRDNMYGDGEGGCD
jgi:hypothetical protein